jgi:hypothetical protein
MREAINDGVSALFAKKRRWPMLVLPAVLFLHGSANGAQSDAQAQSVADDASQAQAVRKASEAADIETIDQLTVQHGRVAAIGVAVIGIYQPMNLSKRTDRPAVHVGRMQLILRDGQSVMLEAGDRGIRDADEIERFSGRQVRVEGLFDSHCLAWGDGSVATIAGPCLRNISRVEKLD